MIAELTIVRRGALAALLTLALAQGALAADKVAVGIGGSASDAPLFIAKDMGFFDRQGLDVELVFLDSGAKVIPPLGTGQLDAGSGALSVGFYNAVARGVHFRVVADRGHTDNVSEYQSVFVRKDLVDSGQFKSLADMKGKKFGFAAPGITALSLLNEAAKVGHFDYADVTQVFLSFPEQASALQNKAIDGSFLIEPQAEQLVRAGVGVRFMNTNDFYPAQVISTVFYSDNFAGPRREVAARFMEGWLAAVRVYTAALQGGKLTGPGSDAIVPVLARELRMDPAIIRAMYAAPCDPNGDINLDSLRKDLGFFKSQGWVPATVDLDSIVDLSFAHDAVAKLGRYAAKAP